MTTNRRTTTIVSLATVAIVTGLSLGLQAQQVAGSWQQEKVNWEAGAGRRIKAIHFPKDRRPSQRGPKSLARAMAQRPQETAVRALAGLDNLAVLAIDVNNPPVDGFVPWIAVGVTQERKDAFEFDAVVETSVVGAYPSGVSPQRDYMIGIFDTGAGAHVIG
jgi:hypothetical protein